jgi:predicted DNA-binding transcriptional regulator YafY
MANPEIVQRHARVLRLLSHLQSGVGLNALELSRHLKVCRRTIFRDLKLMREAGVDVYYDARHDCYRLSSERDIVLLPSFADEDLATLIAAIRLSLLAKLPFLGDSLQRSTAKLLSRSPRPVRHAASRLADSFVVRTPFPSASQQAVRVLAVLLQAIQCRQVVRLAFRGSASNLVVHTHFAPYRVMVSSERWEVTGRSTCHRGIHTFDPGDLQNVELTDESYAIPRAFLPID